jgi:hypothetical protein
MRRGEGWLAGWSGAGIDLLDTFDEAIEGEDFILFVVWATGMGWEGGIYVFDAWDGYDGLHGYYMCAFMGTRCWGSEWWKQRFKCNIMSEYLSTTSFCSRDGVFVCCDEIQG